MAVSPARIEIHIEELVLHGVEPADRRSVGDALQRELETLVACHGVPALLSRPEGVAQQSARPITLTQSASPAALGAEVARSVHRGWR